MMKSMDVQKLWRSIALLLMALLLGDRALAAENERNLAVSKANNAVSEQRIALVIGNSAYRSGVLRNPVNDAHDIANKLRKQGFTVIERTNLQTRQIGGTLREFRSKLVPGAVALVFYAGHGLQIKGENYLPAVDAEINSEEDVPNQSLAVRQIMDVLDEAKTRLNLVFLDACRNNPYSRSFRSAAGDGLARISAPSGTLISYATRPGSVAADGDGRNGLYTSMLLKQMDSKLQIELALKRVVGEVKAASQGRQEPWMEGSIEGDFCFGGCISGGVAQVTIAQPQPAVVDPDALELDAWNTAKEMNTEDAYQAYLAGHAEGRHAKFAQAAINKLKATQQPTQTAMLSPGTTQGGFDNSELLKIAVIDVKRCLKESAPAIEAEKRINAKFEERDREIKELSKRGESEELKALKERYKYDLNAEKNKELEVVLSVLNKKIESLAQAEGLDLVLQEAVYRVPAIDITDYLLKSIEGNAFDKNQLRSDLIARKVAVVDNERLLKESLPAIEAGKRIEAKFKDRDREIKELSKRGESEELKALKERFKYDLNAEKNKEMSVVLGILNKEVASLASMESIDLVLQEAVYRVPAIDITNYILKSIEGTAFDKNQLRSYFIARKVAVVDTERLLNESLPAMEAEKRIEAKFKDRAMEIKELSKRGESEELKALKERYKYDLNAEKNKELEVVLSVLNKKIESLAQAEGLDLVLQEAVYRNPRIDITNRLLERLKQQR